MTPRQQQLARNLAQLVTEVDADTDVALLEWLETRGYDAKMHDAREDARELLAMLPAQPEGERAHQ